MTRMKIAVRALAGLLAKEGDPPCPMVMNLPNPKIKLDSGKEVWGFEC